MTHNFKGILLQLAEVVNREETLRILGEEMIDARLLGGTVRLGTSSVKSQFKQAVQQDFTAYESTPPNVIPLKNSRTKLQVLYEQHRKRAQWVLVVSSLILVTAVSLVLWGLSFLWNKTEADLSQENIFYTGAGILIGLLNTFLIKLYQQENDLAAAVQKDIRVLYQIENQFDLLTLIPDEETRKAAYLKVIEGINKQ